MVVGPLQLIREIQAAVYDERVHVASLWAETGDAISALLGSAEFELEQRLVSRADYAEVVGHAVRLTEETRKSGSEWQGPSLLP